VPRGYTALLDAIGRSVNETGESLASMPESERPGLVTVMIVTDGGENSSKEFTNQKVREMIEHQTNVYSWKFSFLGANQDAFSTAGGLGINPSGVANYTTANSMAAFQSMSNNALRMRQATMDSMPVACSYTAEEQQSMTNS
jgi:hypothetical protein